MNELLEKLDRAIADFSSYQSELDEALDHEPLAVIKELGNWNNKHQKMAASVQFFVTAFTKEFEKGGFSHEEANRISDALKELRKKEAKLFKKVSAIRESLVEQRNRLRDGRNALGHYSLCARVEDGKAYLSKDA